MLQRLTLCAALVAAGTLLGGNTAEAQQSTTKPTGTPTTPSTAPAPSGGTTSGGTSSGGTGSGLGGWLSPEMELQVLMDAMDVADALVQNNNIQFSSEIEALFFFLEVYTMVYEDAVIQQLLGGSGTLDLSGLGLPGTTPTTPKQP